MCFTTPPRFLTRTGKPDSTIFLSTMRSGATEPNDPAHTPARGEPRQTTDNRLVQNDFKANKKRPGVDVWLHLDPGCLPVATSSVFSTKPVVSLTVCLYTSRGHGIMVTGPYTDAVVKRPANRDVNV